METALRQAAPPRTVFFDRVTPESSGAGPAALFRPGFLEFFAGSGLVAHGLRAHFMPLWANDICEKKAAVYCANHAGGHFVTGSISEVRGPELPLASLAWASFPCQDLSLAGLSGGIHASRSGLVWEWLRVIDEMRVAPQVLVAENVVGLVSSDGGSNYKALHQALVQRGYRVGAMHLDAVRWLPQSRPRIFVVAIKAGSALPHHLMDNQANWLHSPAIVKVAAELEDWVWWSMPAPPARTSTLSDLMEWDAPVRTEAAHERNMSLIATKHRAILDQLQPRKPFVAPGYKRTRGGSQVLELRFDGVAGCLRTPEGGSSRQVVVIKTGKDIKTRLLTVRETARLMGAPDSYQLPGSYNDGYKAMGDGVAAPVAQWLAKHLLFPLVAANA